MKAEIISEALKGDTLSAVELALQNQDTAAAVHLLDEAMRALYWQHKALPAAIAIGQAGAHLAITASIASQDNTSSAEEFRKLTKQFCFNLGSFTWPGWNEPGIAIGPSDLAVGLAAATANLRLANELQKDELPMSRAHWLMGAHLLAARRFAEAKTHFETSAAFAAKASVRTEELLGVGFAHLADSLVSPQVTAHTDALNKTMSELHGIPDGPSFAEQLETASKVFVP